MHVCAADAGETVKPGSAMMPVRPSNVIISMPSIAAGKKLIVTKIWRLMVLNFFYDNDDDYTTFLFCCYEYKNIYLKLN